MVQRTAVVLDTIIVVAVVAHLARMLNLDVSC